MSPKTAILLIHCPDQRGIISKVTNFIQQNRGNIVYLDEHVDAADKAFFMRIEWDLKNFRIPSSRIEGEFGKKLGRPLKMKWKLAFSNQTPRMAILVSKHAHCLYDILSRWQSAEWKVDIPLVMSNHQDLEPVVRNFGVDYRWVPIKKGNKLSQEKKQIKLLKDAKVDFIVLARYMQILSGSFVKNFQNRIINIHHSFLPAFPGANPYDSAHKRGVKIIGATSHFVTADLDAGPIIEQDVGRVSHIDSIADMRRKGRDLEKVVLARAVWNHLNRKILVYKNKTVVFN